MSSRSYYDPQTGLIVCCQTVHGGGSATVGMPGLAVIDAASEPGRNYVVAGEVRDLPPQPDPHHVWDLPSESWVDPRTTEQVAADDAAAVSALWSELRDERDRRLSLCDWTQVADVPLAAEVRSAWTAYRQALRDLPENTLDPAAPIWPEAPNA
ncbi:tail fiber assembly protein [Rhizorhabdus sp.]|uniref:tail fiber assembly protein n=1 Tax=Rhizorhabdus sp. TaxID=1968843 RepID=UPI0025E8C0D7|nr:tail fiber assembly protein [Rhizorhabdus sp.]